MTWLKRNAIWCVPIYCVLFLTPWSAAIDRYVTQWSYTQYWRKGLSNTHPLLFSICSTVYTYGNFPAIAVWLLSIMLLILSLRQKGLCHLRGPCLTLFFSLAIGSGVITNGIFKEWWGRPRPTQLTEYGGKEHFRPYYTPTKIAPPTACASFPSGHASSGFYFLVFYFIGKRMRKRSLQIIGLCLGLGAGTFTSAIRIIQGGHFVSDCVLGGLIMWISSYVSDRLVYTYQLVWDDANEKTTRSP